MQEVLTLLLVLSSERMEHTMTALGTQRSDDSIGAIRRMELTVMWLWSSEPSCGQDERSGLLARLSEVSIEVERLIFRHEFRADETIDRDAVDRCCSEIDDLARRWTTLGPHPTPVAA